MFSKRTVATAKKTVLRSVLAGASVQAAVIVGLGVMDAIKKRQRTHRKGFPHPGTFKTTVAETDVTVFTYGADLYESMLESIRGAKKSIFLETYIWKGDETGQKFKDALTEAVERGVEVYVIYDVFANLVVPLKFFKFDPRIQVYRFPMLRPSLPLTTIRTMSLDHRKILVVDDEIGYVGGYNIGSLYAKEWRDTHLRISGPNIWEIRNAFVEIWNAQTGKNVRRIEHTSPSSWDSRMLAINNIPANLVYPIRGIYLDAIRRATHHIYITMAYFIPDQQILKALQRASERGVDVRVILPRDSNHVLSDWLSRGFYTTMLDSGIRILLYKHAMIHAKTATIDGVWCTVGTANIDRLSLTGNYETNMEIRDKDLAAHMEEIFAVDSGNSEELTIEEWDKRNFMARFS
ncbi:MAG: phosphatidylserine/phosphatidylglycerophosphate/cardiolipin synthase family protein, partial [Acidobacteria bacterium]|nr:phosphatidylserine/phosphatidylglycerophosphate/cardiolipin synthase family protein [Acidobacteriota bacterium]